MSLLVISLYELKQFLQILMWIAIPVTVVTLFVTILIHYRRKKQEEEILPDQPLAQISAGEIELTDRGDSYLHMLQLQKKYVLEIESGQKEHAQLKEDFKKLEKKHIELIAKNGMAVRSNYASPVFQDAFQQKENEILQLKASILQSEETLRAEREQKKAHSIEINKLGNLLKDMEMVAMKARQETESLHQSHESEKEEMNQLHDLEKKDWQARLERLNQEFSVQKDENARLRNLLIEQESSQDVIEEKNIQIGFLQNQLDNRIKTYHQLEYQSRENEIRLKELQSGAEAVEKELAQVRQDGQDKSKHFESLEEKANQLEEKLNIAMQDQAGLMRTIDSKTNYIEYVENSLRETEERNAQNLEQLNTAKESFVQLHEKFLIVSEKSEELQQKLAFHSQLLMKIYQDLAKSLDPGVSGQDSAGERISHDTAPKEIKYEDPISLEFELLNDESMQFQD
jgi:hypothetical protein